MMRRSLGAALVLLACAAAADAAPCTLFGDRQPASQVVGGNVPRLENCTHYAASACCTPREETALLRNLKPVPGASLGCLEQMNLLYCWPCSPSQGTWYDAATGKLTVCVDICDRIKAVCYDADDSYADGTAVCEGMGYEVRTDGVGCFNAAPSARRPARAATAGALLLAALAAVGVLAFAGDGGLEARP